MDDLAFYLIIAGAVGFGIVSLIFFLLEWKRLMLWRRLLKEVHENASN
ncbi:MAG: hypothetical protein QXP27_04840 [Candidatus Methanomethyliaceae archaeon]